MAEKMKEKFGLHQAQQGFDVERIKDDIIKFATQVLACKLFKKDGKDQGAVGL